MRILIVEDDFTSRIFLQSLLSPFGDCDLIEDGDQAVKAFTMALNEDRPYDLICLDIMMPNMDGHEALKLIRKTEGERGVKPKDEVKVVMTTALNDPKNVVKAYYEGGATAYLAKPIEKDALLKVIREMGLIT